MDWKPPKYTEYAEQFRTEERRRSGIYKNSFSEAMDLGNLAVFKAV